MIVTKIIKGKIIDYESCKENYMKCDAMEGRDECDYISDSYDCLLYTSPSPRDCS